MTLSAPRPRSAYQRSRERLAYADDLKRKALMQIRWRDGDAHEPTEDDYTLMAGFATYPVKYFDCEGEVWWAFFSLLGTSLSVKRLDY